MQSARQWFWSVMMLLPGFAEAVVWETSLASRAATGDTGNVGSVCSAALPSADGRFVAYCSNATNLVPGQVDPISGADVFLHDRQTGATVLVSRADGTVATAANRGSILAGMSADGEWVLIESGATNLVAGLVDMNNGNDVFLYQRSTGTMTLVSRASGSPTTTPTLVSTAERISADGTRILFRTSSADIIPGLADTNNNFDIFLFDRTNGTTSLVSHAAGNPNMAANNFSFSGAFSGDGNWVMFLTAATDIVTGVTDTNGSFDVYLRDLSTGMTTLASRSLNNANIAPNQQTLWSGISNDGRWLLLQGTSTDMVPGVTDANGNGIDLFLFDRVTGTTELVTRAAGSATTTPNQASTPVGLTPDGNAVLFNSTATDIIPGGTDANGTSRDVFVFLRSSGTTTLVSRSLGNASVTANGQSQGAAIAPDASVVVFSSQATDVIAGVTDANGTADDIFLFHFGSGTTRLVSRTATGAAVTGQGVSRPSFMSTNGNLFAWVSDAANLLVGTVDLNFGNDVFVHDIGADVNSLVSRAQADVPATPLGNSQPHAVSGDGSTVLFWSEAPGIVAGVTKVNSGANVFVFDRGTGARAVVSRAATGATTGNQQSMPTAISSDGRYVLYQSLATDLVAGVVDTNGGEDVFLHDRMTGANILVSRALGSATTAGNGSSFPFSMSPDGNWIAYMSLATDILPGITDNNNTVDIFLFERATGNTTLVTRAAGSAVTTPSGPSERPLVSADGNRVVFESDATNLIAGMTNANGTNRDVFLFDKTTGTTTLVSRSAASATTTGSGSSTPVTLSGNGQWILFRSNAINLIPGGSDPNGGSDDAFLHEIASGNTILVSRAAGSTTTTGNFNATPVAISHDGNWVVYQTAATNVIAGLNDTNGSGQDVFLFDRGTGTVSLVSRALGNSNTTASGASFAAAINNAGNRVLFYSVATNIDAGIIDSSTAADVWMFDRTLGSSTLLSRSSAGPTVTPNGSSIAVDLDDSGERAAFYSLATNIDAGALDVNGGTRDAFIVARRFEVTTNAGAGGSLSPGGIVRVDPGRTQSFSLVADTGYSPASASGCGGTWTGSNPYVTASINADCTVTATFAINQYALAYQAGPNGSVSGSVAQTVNHGASGTPVTAVPATGYHFVQWSDGSTANPRTDTNVTGPVSVTAQFANDAPTLAAVTDRSVAEDSGSGIVLLAVGDLETPPASLAVVASSGNPALVPHPVVQSTANPGERSLVFTPVANGNGGPVTVTVTVTDAGGAIAQRTFGITVRPVNDAPTLTLAAGPGHPAASTGAQSVPGFATVVFGPPDEASGQAVLDYLVDDVADPAGVLASAPDISNAGTLTYALTGVGGEATVTVRVRDNGGTTDAGVDTSAAQAFTISVTPGADLQVAIDNTRGLLLDGEEVLYAVVVANAGPNMVTNAGLTVVVPAALTNVAWTCQAPLSTATCPVPGTGTGAPNLSVNLGVNQFLRFDVVGIVDGAPDTFVPVTATATVPGGVTGLVPANDSATDSDPIVPEGVFRNGFEDGASGLTVPGAREALRR